VALRAYLGRQAIFTADLELFAYELLYRNSAENRAVFDDADAAVASTLLTALADLGLDAVAGDRPVFVNLTADYVLGRRPLPLVPGRVFLEVLEDVPATPEVLDALRRFRGRGYQIALDDFVVTPANQALLELADIVKVDVLRLADVRAQLPAQLAAIRAAGARPLAEKVESRADFDELRGLGFELFQGYFLEKPVVLQGRALTSGRVAALQVVATLLDARADIRRVERALIADAGLTARLMRMASAASMGRGAPLTNVGQVVQRLGTAQTAALALLVLSSGTREAPLLLDVAAVRARMCEQLAWRLGAKGEYLLLAGLLSVLDALLGAPIEQILAAMPLPAEIAAAVRGSDSPEGKILAAVRAHERDDNRALAALGVSPELASRTWLEAVDWSRALMRAS
jgi:EAL and modified HD-GYP domain-containing signal transduction protein